MKIGVIVGSMQVESNSAKVGRYLSNTLAESGDHSVFVLDLGKTPLPMWENGIWRGDEAWTERLAPITSELTSCDGFVVVSPEYHGMVPAALKNFFLCFGQDSLGHKPAYLVAVSAGTGGAYPAAELRMSSYKNSRICYTPEHCIVRHADRVLNGSDEDDAEGDARIRERLDYGLKVLLEYAKALRQVRSSGVLDGARFANGM
ncbi:MAG: NAD(P)H-dependent oxidoreductase [Pseudomonadota bacterium]